MKSSEFILETAIRLSGTDTEDTPAKKFIRELHADPLRKNLLDPSMTIITSTKAGFSQAELKSVAGNPTRVHISFFQAHPQKEGIGSKGMRALQDMAAEDGLSLELSVWTKGKIDTEILDKFYKDMGFKSSKYGLLVWTPANTKQVDEARKKKDTSGDCFEVAGKNMIHPQDPNIMLVHAFVSGQGPLSGKRFEHAWNEIGDEVIDNSNGRNIHMPKMLYYAIGNINPKDPNEYRSYNHKQALQHLVTTKHWGPWELGATSNSLYEVTPSEMTEGGWDTKVTQGTVIKPAIVNAALKVANRFIKEFKADTPEAIARAEQDKQKILKGLAYVKNQFDIPGTNTLKETSSIMSLNEAHPKNLKDIEYLAQRAGYRRLGKGVDATVFIKGNGEYVIKILTGANYDPADSARTFIKFYRFCESNADSPYLPKFGPINKIKLGNTEQSETFYHTSMERLQPISDMNWKATNFLIRQVGESLTWHEVSQMILKGTFSYEYNAKNIDLLKVYKNPKLKEFMLQNLEQWKEIFYLIKLLKRKRGNSSWDPHRGNIMQRANGTPVIIDPWVD